MVLFASIVLPILFVAIVGTVFLRIMAAAVIFSKVVVGLIIAYLISSEAVLVAGSGLLNFLAWGGIVFVIGFVLCAFPRINSAYRFFCTALVTFFCTFIIYGIAASMFFEEDTIQLTAETVMKVISFGFAFYATKLELETNGKPSPIENCIVITLERVIASLIYGLTAMAIVGCSNVKYCGDTVAMIVLTVVSVVAFIIDWKFLTDRYLSSGKVKYHARRTGSRTAFMSLVKSQNPHADQAEDEHYRELSQEMIEYDDKPLWEEIEDYYQENIKDDLDYWDDVDRWEKEEKDWEDRMDRWRDDDFYRDNDSW